MAQQHKGLLCFFDRVHADAACHCALLFFLLSNQMSEVHELFFLVSAHQKETVFHRAFLFFLPQTESEDGNSSATTAGDRALHASNSDRMHRGAHHSSEWLGWALAAQSSTFGHSELLTGHTALGAVQCKAAPAAQSQLNARLNHIAEAGCCWASERRCCN